MDSHMSKIRRDICPHMCSFKTCCMHLKGIDDCSKKPKSPVRLISLEYLKRKSSFTVKNNKIPLNSINGMSMEIEQLQEKEKVAFAQILDLIPTNEAKFKGVFQNKTKSNVCDSPKKVVLIPIVDLTKYDGNRTPTKVASPSKISNRRSLSPVLQARTKIKDRLSIDITSELGKFLKKNWTDQNIGHSHLPSSSNTSYVAFPFEPYCSSSKQARIDHQLRSKLDEFPVTFNMKPLKEAHEYKFTRKDRIRFVRRFDTGLNSRSRRLKRKMKPCSVEVYRLPRSDISRWTRRRYLIIPLVSLSPSPEVRMVCCQKTDQTESECSDDIIDSQSLDFELSSSIEEEDCNVDEPEHLDKSELAFLDVKNIKNRASGDIYSTPPVTPVSVQRQSPSPSLSRNDGEEMAYSPEYNKLQLRSHRFDAQVLKTAEVLLDRDVCEQTCRKIAPLSPLLPDFKCSRFQGSPRKSPKRTSEKQQKDSCKCSICPVAPSLPSLPDIKHSRGKGRPRKSTERTPFKTVSNSDTLHGTYPIRSKC